MTRDYVNRIHTWPPRRDERSVVLIGAGATGRSDWPKALVSCRRSRDKRSIVRVQGQAAAGTELLQARLLKKSIWLPNLIGGKAPLAARDSSGVTCA